jgi:predicted dehydrogenase
MRIGIIGLGRAGAVHLAACAKVPDMNVVAVCDPCPTARATAAAGGLHTYDQVSQMLDHEQLDAVIICTPPADHARLAIACLMRRLHVLCEKPLALSTRDVMQMFRAAHRNRRLLLVASKFRHVAEIRRMRDMMEAGELGEPVAFEVNFCAPLDMRGRWNAHRQRGGGGVIIDNGCHVFDLGSYLFGPIARVHATLLKPVQQLAVEDSAAVRIETTDRVIGTANVSWSLQPARDSYVVIHGSRGTAEIGWQATRLKRSGEDWHQVGGAYDKLEAHRDMCATFRDAMRGLCTPWISAQECVQNVAAVDAAYRSLRSGSWESVSTVLGAPRGREVRAYESDADEALVSWADHHPDAA